MEYLDGLSWITWKLRWTPFKGSSRTSLSSPSGLLRALSLVPRLTIPWDNVCRSITLRNPSSTKLVSRAPVGESGNSPTRNSHRRLISHLTSLGATTWPCQSFQFVYFRWLSTQPCELFDPSSDPPQTPSQRWRLKQPHLFLLTPNGLLIWGFGCLVPGPTQRLQTRQSSRMTQKSNNTRGINGFC